MPVGNAPPCPASFVPIAYGVTAPFLALALFALAYLAWKALPILRTGTYVEEIETPLFAAYFFGAVDIAVGVSGNTVAFSYADNAGVMCVTTVSPALINAILILGVALIALATLVIAKIKPEEEKQ